MTTILFADKEVSYDTFMEDLASRIVKRMKDSKDDPETMSQRQAYRIFGRANVDRWRKKGMLNTCKRPGKVEYFTSELRRCQQRSQDYFQ